MKSGSLFDTIAHLEFFIIERGGGSQALCVLCSVDRPSLYDHVNRTNLVHNFLNKFIAFLYMFRATMCPSSGEITVSMRHLVFVTLKQVDSLKLPGLIS